MSAFIYFLLKETLADGTLTCEMRTRDPYQALSDFLLKARKPISGDFNRSFRLTTVKIGVESNPVIYNSPAMFDLKMVVISKETDELLYSVHLVTMISESEVSLGFTQSSFRVYKTEGYLRSLDSVITRLNEWSKENLDVARVLTCFASRDPDHPFWNDQNFMTKGLGKEHAKTDEAFAIFDLYKS